MRTVVITERCDRCGAVIQAGSHQRVNREFERLGWRSEPGGRSICRECIEYRAAQQSKTAG